MIENYYELNIASAGRHYARVRFPTDLTKGEAQERAETIAMALQAHESSDKARYSFGLTRIECVGKEVSF